MSHVRQALVPSYLLLCLLLGGASAAGLWANMVLQLLAIPLIFWALFAERKLPIPAAARQLLLLLVLMLAVIGFQLIPLAPGIWTLIPGRDQVASGFALLNQPLPWLPISLAPHLTIASALWLLPAIALLLGILRLGAFKSSWIALVIIAVTMTAVLVGALQVASGNSFSSPWYFYDITNYGVATGFFANANHMATLLVITIPFLAALFLKGRERAKSRQSSYALLVILAGAMTVVVVGLAINASLAGIGLVVPVIGASLLMGLPRTRKFPFWVPFLLGALVILPVVIVFSQPFGNNLTAADAKTSQFSRYTSFTTTLRAAEDFAPLGSGIGTFGQIYPRYEDPNVVEPTYMNHTHSDLIELALETGIAGILVVVLLILWWFRRVFVIWAGDEKDFFAMAASIGSGAILAHSLVDYPLRTAAISGVFAICCALMATPLEHGRGKRRGAEPEKAARHLSAD